VSADGYRVGIRTVTNFFLIEKKNRVIRVSPGSCAMADNHFRFGICLAFIKKEKKETMLMRGVLKLGFDGSLFTGKKNVMHSKEVKFQGDESI
jgi:hypothetical protein